MRIVVEIDDKAAMLNVTCKGVTYRVSEAHFRFDGMVPVMDLSHDLADPVADGLDITKVSSEAKTYMDGSPIT